MKKYISLIVVLILIICGCKGISEEKIIGKYFLIQPDYLESNRTLGYETTPGNYIGIVLQTVFAVGFNENYMIVKQHPANKRNITNYFIVPIYKGFTLKQPTEGVLGPLNKIQFDSTRLVLNISDSVKFTKEYNDYE